MKSEQSLNETAQSPAEHARSCWRQLTTHCHANRCNCHLGIYGSVHIIAGCETGRMLAEEYEIATQRVRDLFQIEMDMECHEDAAVCDCSYHENLRAAEESHLEAGDMGSTLEKVRT